MKGEIIFHNAHTIVISHYCVLTETLSHLIHRGFRLPRLCRGCGFHRLFTKILKPVYAMLHQMGRLNVGYITDSYLQRENKEDCQANISDTCDLFSKLGFTLHPVKSVLKPVQVLTFLGFVLNSVDMTVSLTQEKSSTLR